MSKSSQEKDMKQWEDVLCPICMEPPHNAVLLICSSHDKGCRPFICDTSSRLSNCLDKLFVSVGGEPSPVIYHPQEFVPNPRLICPLCRGTICGWKVIESARKAMDTTSRSCPSETCDFVGTYSHLITHVNSIHPLETANFERSVGNWREPLDIEAIEDLISTLEPFQQLQAYAALAETLERLLERQNAVIMENERLNNVSLSRRNQELERDQIQASLKEKKEERLQNMNKHGADTSQELGRRRRLQNVVSLNDGRPSKKMKTRD